jgi:hypothetical protein
MHLVWRTRVWPGALRRDLDMDLDAMTDVRIDNRMIYDATTYIVDLHRTWGTCSCSRCRYGYTVNVNHFGAPGRAGTQ